MLGCVAIGGLFALPVLLRPIARDTGWSTTGISTAMTLAFIAMALGSVAWGNLSDRIGPRPVVLTGAVLLAAGLWLASLASSLLMFQLCFGVVVGLAASAVFPPLMACVTGWFDTHRSLAVSLVSAGMGMAPMTMSPLVAWLVQGHDWRSTLPDRGSHRRRADGAGRAVDPPASGAHARAPPDAAAASPASAGQVLRSAPFLILTLMSFLSCATHSGPIFHTVSYAVTCGIPLMVAVSIYSLEGVSGMVGRLVFGLLGDRFGAARVLTLALLAQAVVALGYADARELGSFYTVAALFGFTYAGVMPLFAVIARENFLLHLMGTVIGGTATRQQPRHGPGARGRFDLRRIHQLRRAVRQGPLRWGWAPSWRRWCLRDCRRGGWWPGEGTEAAGACAPVARADVTALLSPSASGRQRGLTALSTVATSAASAG